MRGRFNPDGTFTFITPDFLSNVVGCLTEEDGFVHLGELFSRRTVCGGSLTTVLPSKETTVTCPECIAEMKYRRDHPEARSVGFGVVTHK